MWSRWAAMGGLLLITLVAVAAANPDASEPAPPHANVRIDSAPPQPAAENGVSNDPEDAPTTTMDPLDEFCKEACEEGIGGNMCDCPDHPIG